MIQVSVHTKFVDDCDSRDSFLAEGEYQFSYNSLQPNALEINDIEGSQSPASLPPIMTPNPHPAVLEVQAGDLVPDLPNEAQLPNATPMATPADCAPNYP